MPDERRKPVASLLKRDRWSRSQILIALALAGLLAALAAYWSVLLTSHREQQREVEAQTWLRVGQMAQSASVQVQTLLAGLDYTLQSLGALYAMRDRAAFADAVQAVQQAYPVGTVMQVAVADAAGNIVYSSLEPQGQPRTSVTIRDREHFEVHAQQQVPGMFVSRPVLGRVSQRWSIQLSRALQRDGVFIGVLVLSLSPDHIAQYFEALASGTGDVIVLLRSDGSYLARSQRQNEVLGTSVPPDRAGFFQSDQDSGRYSIDSPMDGLWRLYAWHRVEALPLVVSAGMDHNRALAPVRAEFVRIVTRNAVGTALILAGFVAAAWLALLRERSERLQQQEKERYARLAQQAIALSEERLRATMRAVRDGLWEWDRSSGVVLLDARCAEILGHTGGPMTLDAERFMAHVHPADRQRLHTRLRQHLASGEEFRVEIRLRTAAGGWRSIESRGEVTQRDDSGRALQMLGTQTDIQQRVEQTNLIHALLDRSSALVLMATPQRRIAYANERAAQAFGLAVGAQALQAQPSFRLLHLDDASFTRFHEVYAALQQHGQARIELQLRLADGSVHWFDVQGSRLDPQQEGEGEIIWTLLDIDARRRAESALEHARRTLGVIIDRFPSGVLVADAQDWQIVAANRQLLELLGLQASAPPLVGLAVAQLPALVPESLAQALLRSDGQGGFAEGKSLQALAGERFLEIKSFALLDQGRRIGHCWVFSDVTERRQRETRLETMALTDALTGEPNRRAFLERLDTEMQHLRAGLVGHAALVMLDIDHFKRVNDTWGHAAGDVVLREMAQTLAQALRRQDMVGRIGGEEFALLLSGANAEVALERAEELRLLIAGREILLPDSTALHITISLGVCSMEAEDESGLIALERSDTAMYFSKRSGRNRTTCWSADLPAMAEPAPVAR